MGWSWQEISCCNDLNQEDLSRGDRQVVLFLIFRVTERNQGLNTTYLQLIPNHTPSITRPSKYIFPLTPINLTTTMQLTLNHHKREATHTMTNNARTISLGAAIVTVRGEVCFERYLNAI
jgi:hypothetical protein